MNLRPVVGAVLVCCTVAASVSEAEHEAFARDFPEAHAIGLHFRPHFALARLMGDSHAALPEHAEFSGMSFASSSALSSTQIFRA